MAILGVDQVSVAVHDLDDATRIYERILGLRGKPHDEVVPEQGVKTRFFPLPGGMSTVEALVGLGPETPVGKFLAKRGPGLHHVAYQVRDIDATLESLRGRGLRLIDEMPRTGIRSSRVAFLHPTSTGGVLTEIVEPAEGSH